jgi:hypothetical protein
MTPAQMQDARRPVVTRRQAGLVTVAALAVFAVALLRPPAYVDDVVHYSAVKQMANPLSFFLGDSAVGNHPYRPLHWVVEWVSYRLFGVWALPDLLLEVLLHALIVILLLDVMLKIAPQRDDRLPLLLALGAVVSPYSFSAATLMTDRPMLMVALALLMAIRHMFLNAATPRLAVVAAWSVFALLSKESGVIVPTMAIVYGLIRMRASFVGLGVGLIAAYFALRAALFGSDAITWAESGYLLGIWHYEDSSQFTGVQHLLLLADNAVKNVIGIVLPLIGEDGELPTLHKFMVQTPLWLSTLLLFALAGRRPWSRAQQLAMVVIVLNAVIHASLFRYRMLYIPQLALMAFVASSPSLSSPRRRTIAIALASMLLVFNTYRTQQYLQMERRLAYELLADPQFGEVGDDEQFAVDPATVNAIKQMYLPTCDGCPVR